MTANSDYPDFLESDDYFDTLAVFSDGPLHPGAARANDWLFGETRLEGLRLLEVGLGTGWTHRYLTVMGAEVMSIEPNALMRRRSIESGVERRQILPHLAEDLSDVSIRQMGSFDGLVVQAAVGFLAGGLEVIESLFSASGARRLWIADWYGEPIAAGRAPLRETIELSDYVNLVTKLNLKDIRLRLDSESMKAIIPSRAEAQLSAFFPESAEIGDQHIALAKLERDFDSHFNGKKNYLWLDASS